MLKLIQIPNRNYSLSETPITVAQYGRFCKKTGETVQNQPEPQHPDNPVTQVTWYDAVNYCNWLGEKYRLPTEDEFEHCCGDHINATEDIAVFAQEHIKPVKTKQPNKYGLYDMLGCVWEWQNSELSKHDHVVRGGSWYDPQKLARCAFRLRIHPDTFHVSLGFRVALSSDN